MPRSRNLKPGFFANEELAECAFGTRLCFAGLWLLADRDGRLEDRPKRIKGALFPFDSIEVEPMLDELHRRRFILRYRDQHGRALIQILRFAEHQRPHFREPPSELPPPPSTTSEAFNGVEARESLGSAPIATGSSPADESPSGPGKVVPDPPLKGGPAALIPDSGFLIPDSVATPRVDVARATSTRSRAPPCPTERIVELWNAVCAPPLRSVAVVNDARRAAIGARWREVCVDSGFDRAGGVDWFEWLLRERIAGSDFLTGRSPRNGRNGGTHGRAWRATLDWVLDPTNFAKVVDGNYENGGTA